MKLRIINVQTALSNEWDEAWQNCEYATYFHSREWADIWHACSNHAIHPEPKIISFSDGKKAVIPLSYHQKPWFNKNYFSSLEGTYGGWISKDELSVAHKKLLVDYMLKKCGNIYWVVNPYDPDIFKTGIKPSDHETQTLNLSIGWDAILKGFSEANIRAIRKAQKHGVVIRLADALEDWQEYYKLYKDSLSRWGEKTSSSYDWNLFKEIHSCHSNNVRLWLSIFEGKVVSGALCFYAKNHIVYWHGATLKDYFSYRPVNFLFHEIIKDAVHNHYTWFDFNPSGGHEGVKNFKQGFGVLNLNCPIITVGSSWDNFFTRVRNCILNVSNPSTHATGH